MKYILTLSLLLSSLSVSAQVIGQQNGDQHHSTFSEANQGRTIKDKLSAPVRVDSITTIYETINVIERGDSKVIVGQNLKVAPKNIKGYRVVIFMKNSQTARGEAITTQKDFSSQFPDVVAYLSYENPYFKVSVGNCTTREEAVELLGRLHDLYPKAFIVHSNINVREFAR
jgi:hypothetical protein